MTVMNFCQNFEKLVILVKIDPKIVKNWSFWASNGSKLGSIELFPNYVLIFCGSRYISILLNIKVNFFLVSKLILGPFQVF